MRFHSDSAVATATLERRPRVTSDSRSAERRREFEARAREWLTPELFGHVERYALWAHYREWGDRDDLLSHAMEAAWRSLIYAAEQEASGRHSFDGEAGVRPWVMVAVRRRLQWRRDGRFERKANCFDVTGRKDDIGRIAAIGEADRRELRPDEAAERREEREFVRRAMAELKESDREALANRYGFGDREPQTQEAIAERLGLCRQAISLREQRALRRVRKALPR